jgi:hypothetical protein
MIKYDIIFDQSVWDIIHESMNYIFMIYYDIDYDTMMSQVADAEEALKMKLSPLNIFFACFNFGYLAGLPLSFQEFYAFYAFYGK